MSRDRVSFPPPKAPPAQAPPAPAPEPSPEGLTFSGRVPWRAIAAAAIVLLGGSNLYDIALKPEPNKPALENIERTASANLSVVADMRLALENKIARQGDQMADIQREIAARGERDLAHLQEVARLQEAVRAAVASSEGVERRSAERHRTALEETRRGVEREGAALREVMAADRQRGEERDRGIVDAIRSIEAHLRKSPSMRTDGEDGPDWLVPLALEPASWGRCGGPCP